MFGREEGSESSQPTHPKGFGFTYLTIIAKPFLDVLR